MRIPGGFTVYNSMTAAVCAIQLGLPFADVAAALSEATGVPGRIEVVPTDTDYTVIIDYAHSPDGLQNILASLRKIAQARIITVFGCGGDRDRTKRPVMGEIAGRNSDYCVVTSDNPRTEDPDAIVADILEGVHCQKNRYQVIVNRREAIAWVIDNHRPGDVIILAGKGHEDYQIIGKEKFHMDEREIVAAHLEKMRK